MKSGLKKEGNLYLKVPNKMIRNKDINISSDEFLLYSRICYLYFRSYKQKEFTVNLLKMKDLLRFADNRTLKSRLNKLYKYGLIENHITELPRNHQLTIVFNDDLYNSQNGFTLINSNVFEAVKESKINSHAFRLLLYYKSHINLQTDNKFCFVGYQTITAHLKLNSVKIKEANEQLKKAGMIKIVKHKLEPTYEYDHDDELVYNRYNNHYYVADRLH